MLCPSCGKNVGELPQLCEGCAMIKREQDEQREKEEQLEREALGQSGRSSKAAARKDGGQQQEGEDGALDEETKILLVRALGVALVVLIVLLVLVLVLS